MFTWLFLFWDGKEKIKDGWNKMGAENKCRYQKKEQNRRRNLEKAEDEKEN